MAPTLRDLVTSAALFTLACADASPDAREDVHTGFAGSDTSGSDSESSSTFSDSTSGGAPATTSAATSNPGTSSSEDPPGTGDGAATAGDTGTGTSPIDPQGDGDFYEPPPYVLGPDSQPEDGVPRGLVTQHAWDASDLYPGTSRPYWVYVPAQYDATHETAVMVFQDGGRYINPAGFLRTPIVLDNLIHRGDIPVLIGVFVEPGTIGNTSNRSIEYDTVSDHYARFLLEEILPAVEDELALNLSRRPEDRAIGGHSSGGSCAFTVGWERPDAFGRIMAHNGSFVDIAGADAYAQVILDAPLQPLRVFLLAGTNDLVNASGSWFEGNQTVAAALADRGYHYRFVYGDGDHSAQHAGAVLPDTLRWLWREPLE
jgi:enterochelin esterase family protein